MTTEPAEASQISESSPEPGPSDDARAARQTGPPLVPETVDRLIEERDHLLRSIRDLEREFSFGDISEDDFHRLRDQYTVRAADVLRELEAGEKSRSEQKPAATSGIGGWKIAAISVLVVVFAAFSGVMVARSSGQRGTNPITGAQGSVRDRLSKCQPLAFQDPSKGIACYAEILEKAPENVEALTYQGWAYVRADKIEQAGENFAKVVEIDPGYPDVRVFRAVVAVRAGDFSKASEELTLFYQNDPSPMAVQVLQSQGLEREIFFGVQPAPVRECWQKAAEAGKGSEKLDEKFYGTLGTCLDTVLGASPESVDALVSRAFAAAGIASVSKASTIDAATPFLERALLVDPVNGNALVLRASLNAANARPVQAKEDLQKLQSLPRPTISFLTGGPEQISQGL